MEPLKLDNSSDFIQPSIDDPMTWHPLAFNRSVMIDPGDPSKWLQTCRICKTCIARVLGKEPTIGRRIGHGTG